MEKQVDLTGQPITADEENPDVAVLKSALQKAIRRGMTEKAMAFSLMLLERGGWFTVWRRLRIIAVEDCCVPETIMATELLYKQFLEHKGKKNGEISWDAKRCVVAAAFLLASSKKCRIPDEFMELWSVMEKRKDVALQNLKELWTSVPDEAFDVHTQQGRRMGRGNEYWYQVSSKCENMTEEYARWRSWWEGLMLTLCRKEKLTRENNTNYLTKESEKRNDAHYINMLTPEEEEEK